MSKTIGVISIKGGVGKTTISAALAADLVNNYGKKVLLIDANYSAPNLGMHMDVLKSDEGNISDVLTGNKKITACLHNRYGVDIIPGGDFDPRHTNIFKLRDKIERMKNAYDYVIIDSSPNLNNEILSTMLASDILFMVSTPDFPTLSCSLKAAELAKQRGRPIAGIIFDIEKATGIPVVARISDEKDHGRALYSRIPMSLYKRNSKCAKEVRALSAAITGMKNEPNFWSKLISFHYGKEVVNRALLKDQFYAGVFDRN